MLCTAKGRQRVQSLYDLAVGAAAGVVLVGMKAGREESFCRP